MATKTDAAPPPLEMSADREQVLSKLTTRITSLKQSNKQSMGAVVDHLRRAAVV